MLEVTIFMNVKTFPSAGNLTKECCIEKKICTFLPNVSNAFSYHNSS